MWVECYQSALFLAISKLVCAILVHGQSSMARLRKQWPLDSPKQMLHGWQWVLFGTSPLLVGALDALYSLNVCTAFYLQGLRLNALLSRSANNLTSPSWRKAGSSFVEQHVNNLLKVSASSTTQAATTGCGNSCDSALRTLHLQCEDSGSGKVSQRRLSNIKRLWQLYLVRWHVQHTLLWQLTEVGVQCPTHGLLNSLLTSSYWRNMIQHICCSMKLTTVRCACSPRTNNNSHMLMCLASKPGTCLTQCSLPVYGWNMHQCMLHYLICLRSKICKNSLTSLMHATVKSVKAFLAMPLFPTINSCSFILDRQHQAIMENVYHDLYNLINALGVARYSRHVPTPCFMFANRYTRVHVDVLWGQHLPTKIQQPISLFCPYVVILHMTAWFNYRIIWLVRITLLSTLLVFSEYMEAWLRGQDKSNKPRQEEHSTAETHEMLQELLNATQLLMRITLKHDLDVRELQQSCFKLLILPAYSPYAEHGSSATHALRVQITELGPRPSPKARADLGEPQCHCWAALISAAIQSTKGPQQHKENLTKHSPQIHTPHVLMGQVLVCKIKRTFEHKTKKLLITVVPIKTFWLN